MGTRIEWKEFEQRLQQSTAAFDFQAKPTPKPSVVPVYIVWPHNPTAKQTPNSSFAKTMAVFGGILAAGIALGTLLATWVLPV
ncbi:MAG: hypothetical protein J7M25_00315 [Deltaproteobacteria bacterium]|nr:hypothetical protein [Deltaproteobacteria bacterium]